MADAVTIERPPIVIEFMLNCYYSYSPETNLGVHRWDSSAGRATRRWLWTQGLIDEDNRPTPRGTAWVKSICETPMPPVDIRYVEGENG